MCPRIFGRDLVIRGGNGQNDHEIRRRAWFTKGQKSVDESAEKTPDFSELPLEVAPWLLVFPPYYFPTNPSLSEWILAVDGFAARPGDEERLTTRFSIAMMGRLMRAQPHELKGPLFLGRVAPFIAKGLHRLSVEVQVGLRRYRLPRRTNGRGAFRGRLRFTADELCRVLDMTPPAGQSAGHYLMSRSEPLEIGVAVHPALAAPRVCTAIRIPWQGWSVISDIDDTIKDSQVSPLRQLLANTFLRQFRSIEGMPELYRQWEGLGCQFHYVSSSPWQLLSPLQRLCQQAQFPGGTFHLRTLRLGADWMRKMLLRQRGKAIVISSLLATFPQRRFILVGDSGERDPEIYCHVAKRFPQQVQAVYIRQVSPRPVSGRRLLRLTEGLPSGLCHLFEDAAELAERSHSLVAAEPPTPPVFPDRNDKHL